MAPCFVAFYADCEHEVKRVEKGQRLCLAYNLVLRKQRDNREHMDQRIRMDGADITTTVEKKGSPYILVLKKTQKSYLQAVQRFETDRRLLASLPPD